MIRFHFNPFDITESREIVTDYVTIRDIFDHDIDKDHAVICLVNDEIFKRDRWDYAIEPTDRVAFVAVPQDFIFTFFVFLVEFIAGAAITSGWVTIGLAAAGTIGVLYLINGLLPEAPTFAQSAGAGEGANTTQSPTYSLSAQGNYARPGAPIPVVYGRHQIYPDFASQPYWEYDENDEQYLYQVFCVGAGKYTLEQIRIEDTSIDDFTEITYTQYDPGQTISMFNPHVSTAVEVGGQELFGVNQLERLDTPDGDGFIGPFIVNPSGTQVDKIGIDIVAQNGLYYYTTTGDLADVTIEWEAYAREVDDDGNPIGIWQLLGEQSLTTTQVDVYRRSFSYTVTAGRYEVKVRRTNGLRLESDGVTVDTRYRGRLTFGGLRGYLTNTQSFDNITILAMKMKATNNLTEKASRKVNCIVRRKVDVYNGSTWDTDQETENPAWALSDVLMNTTYGAGLSASAINLPNLYSLSQTWSQRADRFNGIFDTKRTVWEAVASIARVGRSAAIMQGGRINIIRDQDHDVISGIFTPRNIVKDSFSINYSVPHSETHDSVRVTYLDEKTWKQKELTKSITGTTNNPADVRLFGICDIAQADREAEYLAKANKYRRRTVTFDTELEGFIPTYSSAIRVVHDMPDFGGFGTVLSYSSLVITTDVEVSGSYTIILRQKDGTSESYSATATGANELTLGTTPTTTPYAGQLFALETTTEWSALCRVINITPRDFPKVSMTAVIETYDDNGNNATLYGGRKGLIAADSQVDYTSASDSEKETYGFISDSDPDMSNGDECYTIGIES